jgi:hypothetical protein
VQIETEHADGPVRLLSPWGGAMIERPSPLVREALRRMMLGPISLENVINAPSGSRDDTALALLHEAFDPLQPFIIRSLASESGQPLLSVVPLTPHARFRPMPLPADMRVRLSTFAEFRTDGPGYRLESPLSLHRVLLHRPEAIWLLGSLGRRTAAVACASAWPHRDSLAADALAYLLAIGMVVGAHDAGDEPGVGRFILGRALDTLPRYSWRWGPVNDAQWADDARALLCGR